MSLLYPCPASTALTAISINDCDFAVGQINKLIFQRIYASAGVLNSIVIAADDPTLLATWTALLAADDGTKVVISPLLHNPAMDTPDPYMYGGSNNRAGGEEIVLGPKFNKLTGEIHNVKQNTISTMRNLAYEKGGLLGVYIVDNNGRIIAKADDLTTPTTYYPIPIRSFWVGDLIPGGLEVPDMNKWSFQLPPYWSDLLSAITPADFDALVGLIADATAPSIVSVTSSDMTDAVITFNEALYTAGGVLLTGDVTSYITEPATGSTSCNITTATADGTGKIWTLVIDTGDAAATDTFDLALPVYDLTGNALAATTSICEVNTGGTAWESV